MELPHEHLAAGRMKAPQMRGVNGIRLLNLIGEHGPVSRAGLAKLSRLSKPTVSSHLDELIRRGWAVELGTGEASSLGGKRPTLVKFNADAGRLFAAEIDAGEVRVASADLEGRIRKRGSQPVTERSAGAVLETLRKELGRLIRADSARGMQVSVAVAAPGRVDVRRGMVLEAGNLFNWHSVAVTETLEAELSVPVYVDNDVNMATLGELNFGAAQGERNAVVVRLDTGIGAGIVIRGRLHHGNRWAAGEIAHMILDLGEARRDWRARGYLESVVGADRISRNGDPAVEVLRRGRDSGGDGRALFERVVLHLGIAVANLICAYDPSVVVLQGRILAEIAPDLRAVVGSAVPWETRVVVSEMGADAVLSGAIVAARAQAYERIAGSMAKED